MNPLSALIRELQILPDSARITVGTIKRKSKQRKQKRMLYTVIIDRRKIITIYHIKRRREAYR